MIEADSNWCFFPPFALDLSTERLWRGAEEIPLKPKVFALLHYLAQNPRRLIPKEELVGAVWPDAHISAETLRSTLRDLRRALRDDPKSPHTVETVHGRGYRFIAAVDGPIQWAAGRDPNEGPSSPLVGRDRELAQLRESLAHARNGRRQVVFVVGEPGIGKTSLVEAFLAEVRRESNVLCAKGQSIASYGEGEPYMPLIESLARLCVQEGGEQVLQTLERCSPTWVAEIPAVLDAERRAAVEARAMRIGRERMLHELIVGLEAVSQQQPLALLLEDVHWSDRATLAAIEALARRTEPARLLVIATHRPLEPSHSNLADLRSELHLHRLCSDLTLPPLSIAGTQTYLQRRFPGAGPLSELSNLLFARGEGMPLMMVSHCDQLVRDGVLGESEGVWQVTGAVVALAIPDGVRHLIEHQIDQLSPEEQNALETAAVAGVRFRCEMVSDRESIGQGVEAPLTRLARRRALIELDRSEFRFTHALHQEILYERVLGDRRRRLHYACGRRLEEISAGQSSPVAAELAMHFERGGDLSRAAHYLRAAADVATHRSSHEEAAILVRRALRLLETENESDTRRKDEFRLWARLGNCLTMTKGYVHSEVFEAFGRAFDLSAGIDDDTPELMPVLAGLAGFYELRGEHGPASEVTERQVQVAARTGDSYDRVVASLSRAIVCFSIGDYEEAADLLRVCRSGYDPDRHAPMIKPVATDPGVQCLGHGSLVLGGLGAIDEAQEWGRASLALAARHAHVPSRVLAHFYAMTLNQFLRNVGEAARHSALCFDLSVEYGFPYYIPAAMVVGGWAMALQGEAKAGAEQAAQGVAILRNHGARLGEPLYQAMLAEAYGQAGDFDAGLAAVSVGLDAVAETGEIASESFLHWARADLMITRVDTGDRAASRSEIEECLARSIAIARRCGARMQVVGPATSLARWLCLQGRAAEAKSVLRDALADLSSAEDVTVLSDAHAFLATL